MQKWKRVGLYCRLSSRWGNNHTTFYQDTKLHISYGISQFDKNSPYAVSFNVSEVLEWVHSIWNEGKSQLFKLTKEPVERKGKYMYGKLKTEKECIKKNFQSQDVSYMFCKATAILKVESVYKQGKNYHPQVYVEECKCTDVESQQCNILRMIPMRIDFQGVKEA